jgi:hypothetical protein
MTFWRRSNESVTTCRPIGSGAFASSNTNIDLVVQEKGEPFNLMKDIPLIAEEIEELMNS